MTADAYTSIGQLASETTAYGTSLAATTSYCYDPNGNRTSAVYGNDNTTERREAPW